MPNEKEILELTADQLEKISGGIKNSKPRPKSKSRSKLKSIGVVSDLSGPVDTTFKGNVYITSSFDPQSHFENDADNVIDIYEKITGTKLDLNIEEETKEGGQ